MRTLFIVWTPSLKPQPIHVKPKTHHTDNLPVISFYYPRNGTIFDGDQRRVKVMSADAKYITGLEVLAGGKHQFKKFLRSRITGGGPSLLSFNPNAHKA